jgi:hypothetical protein
MPIENKYCITPDMIPKDIIDDWLSDSVGDNWPEFIARRLNAAVKFGLVKSRKQFDDAVDQDYCTICGKTLDGYEAQAVLEEPVAAKNVVLNYMVYGTKKTMRHESVEDAASYAYWAMEDNTSMPVSIEEDGVVVWASRYAGGGGYPELESLAGMG